MENTVQYIWSDLHGELRKFILAKVADPSTAEDLLQEVFIKIHLHLHQLKDPARLTAWVYQICRRVIADHYKTTPFTRLDERLPLAEADSDDQIYGALSSCINSKIAQLPAKDREAVLLTYFQNYSQKDLAEFLGLSYSGTKNRVQRAREKLRQDILNCERVEADATGRIVDVAGMGDGDES